MRFRPYGMMTGDGIKRPSVHPQDYSDARFEGIRCGYDRHKNPVIIMRSRQNDPLRWKVVYGFSSVFFDSFKEALDFCNSREMSMITERADDYD